MTSKWKNIWSTLLQFIMSKNFQKPTRKHEICVARSFAVTTNVCHDSTAFSSSLVRSGRKRMNLWKKCQRLFKAYSFVILEIYSDLSNIFIYFQQSNKVEFSSIPQSKMKMNREEENVYNDNLHPIISLIWKPKLQHQPKILDAHPRVVAAPSQLFLQE